MIKPERQLRLSHSVRYPETYKAWYDSLEGRSARLLNKARARAKQRGIICTLTHKWILERLEQGKCSVTGLPFKLGTKRGPWTPSIDRIDLTDGYTLENSQVVVWLYNAAKGDCTHEDVLVLAQALTGGVK